jgi:hypothetical protein
MAGLKPSEEIIAATFGVTAVVGIFANMTPNMGDVRADTVNGSNNPVTHKSTRAAAITSAIIVSGMALLGKSPSVFVAGAATIVILSVANWHANAISGATGVPTTAVGE